MSLFWRISRRGEVFEGLEELGELERFFLHLLDEIIFFEKVE